MGVYNNNLYIAAGSYVDWYKLYMYNINSQAFTFTGYKYANITCPYQENNTIYFLDKLQCEMYLYNCDSNTSTLIINDTNYVIPDQNPNYGTGKCDLGNYIFKYKGSFYALPVYVVGGSSGAFGLFKIDINSPTNVIATRVANNINISSDAHINGIVESNNLIYIFTDYNNKYYVFDGSTAVSYRIPTNITHYMTFFVHENTIYCLDEKFLYSFDPKTNAFTALFTSKFELISGVTPTDNIFFIENYISNAPTIISPIIVNTSCNPYTVVINSGQGYSTGLIDNSENSGDNTRYLSEFSGASYFGASGTEESSPIYYGDGSKWIKFKN